MHVSEQSRLILGVSGLRGIVGGNLTDGVTSSYASAFGSWLRDRDPGSRVVAVGRDGRANGSGVLEAAVAGLTRVGLNVIDVGVVTTPTAGLCVRGGVGAALVVTASHNPGEWNGLKCLVPIGDEGACAPSAAMAGEIIERFERGDGAAAETPGSVERAGQDGAVAHHVDRVMDALGGAGDGALRVAVDSVNASGTQISEVVMGRLGVESTQLFGDGSGEFPHTPEPTAENLSGAGGLRDGVVELGAACGFAQDPDADRLALIDEAGRYIGEEYTLVLCAMALLSMERSDDRRPVLVVNLSTSRMIDDLAHSFGARVERTAVGEANVVERMVALTRGGERVVLGGEGNGGVIWPRVSLVRDSVSGMALIVRLLRDRGVSLSELVAEIDAMGPGGSGYTIVKRKAPLARKEDAEPAVRALAEKYGADASARVDTQDGVRVDWDGRGVWAHVRASNTEPIMRVIVEAPGADEAEAAVAEVEAAIKDAGAVQ